MLTEKAEWTRMWGWIPTLGRILSEKRIPDRYYGASSVSDNRFEGIIRLMKTCVLIQENWDAIEKEFPNEALRRELHEVTCALEHTAEMFRQESKTLKDRCAAI